jgi:hypothetical protein
MARGSMSNGRKVSRPALGQNNTGNYARPKPAYAKDNGTPRVISMGKQTKPKDIPTKFKGKRIVSDATPKVIQL